MICRYKNALKKADKDNLIILVSKQKHALVRTLSYLVFNGATVLSIYFELLLENYVQIFYFCPHFIIDNSGNSERAGE